MGNGEYTTGPNAQQSPHMIHVYSVHIKQMLILFDSLWNNTKEIYKNIFLHFFFFLKLLYLEQKGGNEWKFVQMLSNLS